MVITRARILKYMLLFFLYDIKMHSFVRKFVSCRSHILINQFFLSSLGAPFFFFFKFFTIFLVLTFVTEVQT